MRLLLNVPPPTEILSSSSEDSSPIVARLLEEEEEGVEMSSYLVSIHTQLTNKTKNRAASELINELKEKKYFWIHPKDPLAKFVSTDPKEPNFKEPDCFYIPTVPLNSLRLDFSLGSIQLPPQRLSAYLSCLQTWQYGN